MTKILVTGATGFIGHHVVQWLVNHDYGVITTGTSEKKAKKFSWYDSVKFVAADYYSEEENLPVEMRFLPSFAEYGKTKIIVAGTCYEYGVVNGCLSEDMLTNPTTVYGIAKDTLRRYLLFLAEEYGFSWNWVRLFFLYSEGQNPKSLFPQIDAAIARGDTEFPMSGGEQLRDYLPVEKIAEYICRIALQSDVSGIVNYCSGKCVSVRRPVERRGAELDAKISLKFGVYGYPAYESVAFWGDALRLHEVIDDA
ncbi:NAD-dependent epimerase/dehydratase family protein [Methanorbis furvi]|uniref:dTDP-6-deoxy-L-talose 4-dehydrogenase (NAD(+)) n=1 Tax=Methanorbis furvi TaxID=3028299 RepID=A0AAE4SAF1_9EURY|nr:dTDP-6-deoxy-L-talose 4-dehydrogenase (NAD(+)) [Methanocorpusculaceae archaeon Ag1]